MNKRKPLTLDELRGMDGKPVLFVSLKDGRRKWRVVQSIEKLVEVVKVICFTDDDGEPVESYGKTWLAYAAEPTRFDRSAWEPCENCEDYSVKYCENCAYQGNPVYRDPCKSCYCANNWEPKKNFCSVCGRPLTDAAWEMLEKRLELKK